MTTLHAAKADDDRWYLWLDHGDRPSAPLPASIVHYGPYPDLATLNAVASALRHDLDPDDMLPGVYVQTHRIATPAQPVLKPA